MSCQVTPENTLGDVLRLMTSDKTHHIFVVSASSGVLQRVITPADVLRTVATPSFGSVGWRYREETARLETEKKEIGKKKQKVFDDGARDGSVSRLEPGGNQTSDLGFAGRFDDEA